MITLLIDPESKFRIKQNYIRISYNKLPKSFNNATDIMNILVSRSIDESDKYVAIEDVDKLDETKSALLTRILILKPDTTFVLLTATSEQNISKHIFNMAPIIKRMKGTVKKERTIWQNLKLNLLSRRIPDDDELFLFLRSIGDTRDIHNDNRELAAELDVMLFKTHSRYLSTAWAGLHKKESRRLQIKSFKKKETKPKLKAKVRPNKIKKAKQKVKTQQKLLEEWL